MSRFVESALHLFQQTTMDRGTEAMVETRAVTLFENANQYAVEGQKTPVYWAVEKIVHRVFDRGALNYVVHMNCDNLAESQDFAEHLTSILINNTSFIVHVKHVLKQHVMVAVTDMSKVYDQCMANQSEEATPPSPLAGIFQAPLH